MTQNSGLLSPTTAAVSSKIAWTLAGKVGSAHAVCAARIASCKSHVDDMQARHAADPVQPVLIAAHLEKFNVVLGRTNPRNAQKPQSNCVASQFWCNKQWARLILDQHKECCHI